MYTNIYKLSQRYTNIYKLYVGKYVVASLCSVRIIYLMVYLRTCTQPTLSVYHSA